MCIPCIRRADGNKMCTYEFYMDRRFCLDLQYLYDLCRLYWCDAYTDKIESINAFNGGDRRTVTMGDYVQQPYSLTQWADITGLAYVFWTEFKAGHIYMLNITSNRTNVVRHDSVYLFDLKLYDSSDRSQQRQGTSSVWFSRQRAPSGTTVAINGNSDFVPTPPHFCTTEPLQSH